jgi:cytidylate kinase
MKIIGLGGTDASGKDTIGEMLAERHGWLFISVTELLRTEAKKRGLPLTRQNLREISAEWRRQQGMGVLIDKAVEQFKSEKRRFRGLAISSLRNPGEADEVHRLGGKVVWTDADSKVRYERVAGRNRGSEDKVTFKEFLAEEKTQMSHSGDEATLNLGGVKDRADIFIENNGTDIKRFKDETEKILFPLLK